MKALFILSLLAFIVSLCKSMAVPNNAQLERRAEPKLLGTTLFPSLQLRQNSYQDCVKNRGNGSPTFKSPSGQLCTCQLSGSVLCIPNNNTPLEKCIAEIGKGMNPHTDASGKSCLCQADGTVSCTDPNKKCRKAFVYSPPN